MNNPGLGSFSIHFPPLRQALARTADNVALLRDFLKRTFATRKQSPKDWARRSGEPSFLVSSEAEMDRARFSRSALEKLQTKQKGK